MAHPCLRVQAVMGTLDANKDGSLNAFTAALPNGGTFKWKPIVTKSLAPGLPSKTLAAHVPTFMGRTCERQLPGGGPEMAQCALG